MAIWWITTIGLLFCLASIIVFWVYGLKGSLNTEDSTRVDPLPKEKD